ncbi:MAG: Holliday junction branch migration protein RuvA [Clostridium sp.]|nr:Holliday junction branch migration protein RuvA [Clostridium sp.]MCM1444732.1 Holliday junction branch migration protein RuvA [Candidatus Amulumruptor caecigallinarius]
MYSYIEGIVKEIESDYITLENNGIGFLIYTSLPYSFNIGEICKIYLYQNVREDELSLYGFKSKEEKNLFLKLINVKGIGCKMALPILAVDNPSIIIDAIEREDISYLKKFPKIGEKVARQIILDLKGKLVSKYEPNNNFDELISALKALGYKTSDINLILPNIKSTVVEEQIKEALKLLLK